MGKKTRHAWGAKTELECRGRSMKRVDEFFVRISKATNSFFSGNVAGISQSEELLKVG